VRACTAGVKQCRRELRAREVQDCGATILATELGNWQAIKVEDEEKTFT